MQVILLEKMGKLGGLGDTVSVKPGYARNFLFPQEKAVFATRENIKIFESRRQELEAKAKAELDAAQKRADSIADITLTITAKAGDGGKLFGSIGTRELAQAISEKGQMVEKHEVLLPEGAIRHVGEYNVSVQVHPEVSTDVKVVIEAAKTA